MQFREWITGWKHRYFCDAEQLFLE